MSNSRHYCVKPLKYGMGWHVWDNHAAQSVRTEPTRKEARRIVVGLNAGWIQRHEVEKAPSGDSAAQG